MSETEDRDPLLVGLDQVGEGIDALKRENAALRSALQGILEAAACSVHKNRGAGFYPDCSCRPCVRAREARAALKQATP